MVPKSLIIGCGYIGLPLALRLQEWGHEVTAWVHSAETAEEIAIHQFPRVIVGSVADVDVWSGVDETYNLVIHCASSGGGGESAYEQVFLKGALLINEYQPKSRRLFMSSTSVYGQSEGEVVTEESLAEPNTVTSRILRAAEKVALGGDSTVIRSSGIYGPGRGVLFEKLQRCEAVIEGDGLRWINQIHQRDLVIALTYLIDAGAQGEIYNVTDDTPVTYNDYYAWCADFLGKPMPPYGPINTQRKRGLSNKRVSNAKLRERGWTPLYPSFREGLSGVHSPK